MHSNAVLTVVIWTILTSDSLQYYPNQCGATSCQNGQVAAVPSLPQIYLRCDGYRFVVCQCPSQQTFIDGLCSAGRCVEKDGAANYKPVPGDPYSFYQCAQGRWVEIHCKDGTVWNQSIVSCDFPGNVTPAPF
ncbi:unnamed protein product [Caenorhabditis auriculariae]|uniref:Chitin-binding type-2 domain-containing protein n=1 Tax=Caenorhabditis auriculariae TaxID=2777116 RepID=A0A8S1H8K7_9PELO|nr:unnamed protein product [Caenorhabditis auriculariae]